MLVVCSGVSKYETFQRLEQTSLARRAPIELLQSAHMISALRRLKSTENWLENHKLTT